jgi:F-type H+-transporting ATPase subunit gamma
MAGGQERILRRRIRTVQSTKKITRAMELIAASQIVRAQGRIAGARPYVAGIGKVLSIVAAEAAGSSRMIGTGEDAQQVMVLTIVGDRGLCGAYNSAVLRATERLLRAGESAGRSHRVVGVGRKAISFFRFRGRELDRSFTQMTDRPTYADARAVASVVVAAFVSGEVDVVELVSTRFRSAGSQVVETRRILPLPPVDAPAPSTSEVAPDEPARRGANGGYYEFEPSPEEILELLVPQYAEAVIYQALLEASASEHTARQRAMAAATENADDLITNLRRVMNRARQDAITTEIMEIVGGAEALRAAAQQTTPVDLSNNEERIA